MGEASGVNGPNISDSPKPQSTNKILQFQFQGFTKQLEHGEMAELGRFHSKCHHQVHFL